MTIKFAARGVSTQFRTAQELVQTDGVTLKPTNGGEVLVYSSDGVQLATAYDATTGGCTVGETTYADTSALNTAGFHLISDAHTAWDLSSTTPSKCGAGEVDVWKAENEEFVLFLSSAKNDQTFSSAGTYKFGFLSENDISRAEYFGLTVDYFVDGSLTVYMIQYDSNNYDYEILGLYSDVEGTNLVYDNVSNLYVGTGRGTGTLGTSLEIFSSTGISSVSAKTWKVRITKREAE